jgi:hypothetical protein
LLVDRLHVGHVEDADEDERRHPDLVEPRPGVGVRTQFAGVVGVQRAAVHLEEEVAQLAAHPALGRGGAIEPQPGLESVELVEVLGFFGGLRLGDDGGGRLLGEVGKRRPMDRWADQRQGAHPVGVSQRDVDRGGAAHRARDQDGPLDADGVHHGRRVVDARPSVLTVVRRLSVLPSVERDASVARNESVDDVRPAAPVGDACVEQDDIAA